MTFHSEMEAQVPCFAPFFSLFLFQQTALQNPQNNNRPTQRSPADMPAWQHVTCFLFLIRQRYRLASGVKAS